MDNLVPEDNSLKTQLDYLSNQEITNIKTGVLFVKGEPFYVVKRYSLSTLDMVACFKIDEDSLVKWAKNGHSIPEIKPEADVVTVSVEAQNPYKTTKSKSIAARIAYDNFNKSHKPIKQYLVKRPLYVSLVTTSYDTLREDGVPVEGFYEFIKTKKKAGVVSYTPTGVFFALDRVVWTKTSIPMAGLVESLKDETGPILQHILGISD